MGSWIYLSQKMMIWGQPRGENVLDTGAHFYETYETKDRKYMAVGAIEPQFYAELLTKIESDSDEFPQLLGSDSDELKVKLADVFKKKTRSEWVEIFDGSDACVTPVLELHEAPEHPHNKARESFVLNNAGDLMAPIPAPRLSRTPATANVSIPEPEMGANTEEILSEFGYNQEDIEKMKIEGTVQQTNYVKKSKL